MLVGIRGTHTAADAAADVAIPLNRLAQTDRFKHDLAAVRFAMEVMPDAHFYLAGHSMAGAVAAELLRALPALKGARTYNAAASPWEATSAADAVKGRLHRVYHVNDPLGVVGRHLPAASVTIVPHKGSILDHIPIVGNLVGHRLNQIEEPGGGRSADDPPDAELKPMDALAHDVQETIDAMSLSGNGDGVQLLGSASLRAVSYASDYDLFETYRVAAGRAAAAKQAAAAVQRAVRRCMALPQCLIGDIKVGVLEQCRVWSPRTRIRRGRVVNYSAAAATKRLAAMLAAGYIGTEEHAAAVKAIDAAGATPTADQWLALTGVVRFDVCRWRPADVLAGRLKTRAGVLTLFDALQQPAVAKMDVVKWLPSAARYCDLSIIWSVRCRGGAQVNKFVGTAAAIKDSIRVDVYRYWQKGSYLKALKRCLSLARMMRRRADVDLILGWLNGPAGRLYAIEADVGTLEYLLEHGGGHISYARVKLELDSMKGRLASVYGLRGVLEFEPGVLAALDKAQRVPSTRAGAARLQKILGELAQQFDAPIQASTRAWLRSQPGWWPSPPPRYLP